MLEEFFELSIEPSFVHFAYNTLKVLLAFKGDPTEECVRCNKVYLASTAELKQGLCPKCLENPIPSDDQENEDVTISHRHKKFANKLLRKLVGESTLSGTEEELSNASSSENLHQVDMD
jgi:predicted  nucleic acid-binding Zn-ribbon protein